MRNMDGQDDSYNTYLSDLVTTWILSGYSGFLPRQDYPNASIGANELST